MAEQGTSRADDVAWMKRALALAANARPSPNPRVGSVVVRDGAVVGEGFHTRVGTDHAEVAALRAAGAAAEGATLYITLEPCNHHGRTPPCTDAILASKVRRVVIGVRDPNPHVRGGGVERLRAAGIEVETGVELPAADELIRAWRKHVTLGSPYVVLKAGMSLDARIATRTRDSKWITGPDARRDAHRLRARADAVMVGVGTVLTDDPMLTPRDVPVPGPLPVRVVLDTTLRTPLASALVRTARDAPTWVVHADDAPEDRAVALRAAGVETIALPRRDDRVHVHDTLRELGRRGIVELLVEGGGAVHGALLDARAADALVCYIAPVLVGGRDAFPAFGGVGAATVAEAHRLTSLALDRVGDDLKVTAEFAYVHGDRHGDR